MTRWDTRSWTAAPCRPCQQPASGPQATEALCSYCARCTISQRTGQHAAPLHTAHRHPDWTRQSPGIAPSSTACRVHSANGHAPKQAGLSSSPGQSTSRPPNCSALLTTTSQRAGPQAAIHTAEPSTGQAPKRYTLQERQQHRRPSPWPCTQPMLSARGQAPNHQPMASGQLYQPQDQRTAPPPQNKLLSVQAVSSRGPARSDQHITSSQCCSLSRRTGPRGPRRCS
jgi:hypothetical protein